MNVLMIGNPENVHGGITSVIQQLLKFQWENDEIDMKFIPSYKGGNALQKIAYFVKAYHKIKNELKNNKPDLVHIHMSHSGSFDRANLIKKLCGKKDVPVVIHLHGSEFKKFYNRSSVNKQKEICEFFSDVYAVIVLGENWKEFIVSISPKANVCVLNNSIAIPKIGVKQSKTNINFLFMGVLIKRKGVIDLLEAINQLKKEGNLDKINVKFNIGGSGEEYEELTKYVETNSLKEYIEFLGWVDNENKENILMKNQVFVLPSYNEGLPIAILEALSYGMPIISTNVGSIDEAVYNERNGYLLQPGNIEELKNKLAILINNFEIRKKMGVESRKIAKEKFDEKEYYKELLKLYKGEKNGKYS